MEVSLILAPFVASLFGFIGRSVFGHSRGPLITTLFMGYAAVVSAILFFDTTLGHPRDVAVYEWFTSGALHVVWSLRVDAASAVMLFVITLVSLGVHVYSLDYMRDDPRRDAYFGNISLFTGFMILLVTSDSLLQLYFGWEGVGLTSYLLINHWYQRRSANRAAAKAFIVNRIGDYACLIGLLATFLVFGSLDLDTIFAKVPEVAGHDLHILWFNVDALTLICILLFIGAMGKSAQLGLHVWLPDAMEAPTPVSALIHAATMVTAGVFMLVRLGPLFDAAPVACDLVMTIGAVTAFMAATIAVTQFDIKRIIAYSTMSQLGFMFVACGVSAYNPAMFHLFTHAFFKALLFLGAGIAIHQLAGEQDLRRMGGLRRQLPFTLLAMVIGSLALSGIPGFAGFYSKEAILSAVLASDQATASVAFILLVLTVPLTAFYSWRLVFAVFFGQPRDDVPALPDVHHDVDRHQHRPVPLMVLVVGALAGGTLVLGGICYAVSAWGLTIPGLGDGAVFWQRTVTMLSDPSPMPLAWRIALPALGLAGIVAAYAAYVLWPGLPAWIAASAGPLDTFLRNRWNFDQVYHKYLVLGSRNAGRRLMQTVDGTWIDGFVVNQTIPLAQTISRGFARLQTGRIYDYALTMIGAVVAVIWWSLAS